MKRALIGVVTAPSRLGAGVAEADGPADWVARRHLDGRRGGRRPDRSGGGDPDPGRILAIAGPGRLPGGDDVDEVQPGAPRGTAAGDVPGADVVWDRARLRTTGKGHKARRGRAHAHHGLRGISRTRTHARRQWCTRRGRHHEWAPGGDRHGTAAGAEAVSAIAPLARGSGLAAVPRRLLRLRSDAALAERFPIFFLGADRGHTGGNVRAAGPGAGEEGFGERSGVAGRSGSGDGGRWPGGSGTGAAAAGPGPDGPASVGNWGSPAGPGLSGGGTGGPGPTSGAVGGGASAGHGAGSWSTASGAAWRGPGAGRH